MGIEPAFRHVPLSFRQVLLGLGSAKGNAIFGGTGFLVSPRLPFSRLSQIDDLGHGVSILT
jgi:hypothetical protein